MASPHSEIINLLEARELIVESCGAAPATHLCQPRTVYCGFDPTADSLHVGSLLPLLALFRFIASGHRSILLLGGATGLIGDPSFKNRERSLQSQQQVHQWCQSISEQCCRIYDNYRLMMEGRGKILAPDSLLMCNNLEWHGEQLMIDFLRETGKHFSVNMMMRREAVRKRLENEDSGISFTEFSYMLLQSSDFVELLRRYGCTVQIGGSDQWGNIVAGIDLIRRLKAVPAGIEDAQHNQSGSAVVGLTMPLVTRSDGHKFGKTETGTVWLAANRTSPYRFYQFWVNSADRDLPRYWNYFAFSPFVDCDFEAATASPADWLQLKTSLADQLTELVHGREGLLAAQRITHLLFSGTPEQCTAGELAQLAQGGIGCTRLEGDTVDITEALVKSGLALTPRGQVTVGQARKFVTEGAIRVNGQRVSDPQALLRREQGLFGCYHLLRRGKKHHHLICWV